MQQSGWKIGGGPNTDPTQTGHVSGGIWGLGTKSTWLGSGKHFGLA